MRTRRQLHYTLHSTEQKYSLQFSLHTTARMCQNFDIGVRIMPITRRHAILCGSIPRMSRNKTTLSMSHGLFILPTGRQQGGLTQNNLTYDSSCFIPWHSWCNVNWAIHWSVIEWYSFHIMAVGLTFYSGTSEHLTSKCCCVFVNFRFSSVWNKVRDMVQRKQITSMWGTHLVPAGI